MGKSENRRHHTHPSMTKPAGGMKAAVTMITPSSSCDSLSVHRAASDDRKRITQLSDVQEGTEPSENATPTLQQTQQKRAAFHSRLSLQHEASSPLEHYDQGPLSASTDHSNPLTFRDPNQSVFDSPPYRERHNSAKAQALLDNELYRQLCTLTAEAIESYVRDADADAHSNRHLHVPYTPSVMLSDTGASEYLNNRQYYNPRASRRMQSYTRNSYRSQLGFSPSGSLRMAVPPSSYLGACSSLGQFSTGPSELANRGIAGTGSKPTDHGTVDAPTDLAAENDFGDEKPRTRFENFMDRVEFIRFCVYDIFTANPYKLPPFVYILLGVCLSWCIIVKWGLALFSLIQLAGRPWDDNARAEALNHLDNTVSVLPILVQLVLFLFPPLLAPNI